VYGNNYYGTSRLDVLERIKDGKSCLKDVDVQGAMKIRKTFPEAVQVFLASPSFEETERRLRGRGTDSEEVIQRRLADSKKEMNHWREFDYVVICDQLPVVIDQLSAIISAEKRKPKRFPKENETALTQ
jgi:guanylate kinase